MEQWLLILGGAAFIAAVLFVLIIVLFVKLSGMKRKYNALMNGEREVNMDELIIGIQEKLNEQGDRGTKLEQQVVSLQQAAKAAKGKVGIHRYSAFGDAGGNDLSFTIAILNEWSDGVVLTGIYGRDQTYIYAKPIQKGVSTYTLSPEEKEAITRTMQQTD